MAELRFTKGHGTGNDFVLVADPDGELDLAPSEIARLCDRHFGIGADGFLRAVRVGADPTRPPSTIPTSTGSWTTATRTAPSRRCAATASACSPRSCCRRGSPSCRAGERRWPIATRGGVMTVQRTATGFAADLGRWTLGADDVAVRIGGVDVVRPGLSIDVPNPHVVVALADDDELSGADLSTPPVLDPPPPAGANVELVRPEDPLVDDGIARIRMRVHERGSGETLSCGTGAVAAALATRYWAGSGAPDEWRVTVPGGVLGVRMFAAEDGEHVALSGPAQLVYTGVAEL